jgi:glycosyltransferase involved in cell wall biosynthesis
VSSPKVSVIVTTKNEEKNIRAFLDSVKAQTYKNIETIVVDNSSTDKTQEISREFTDKVFNIGPERSAQRNYGAKVSTGDYLMVLDADMILTPDVVGECVEAVMVDLEIKTVTIPEKSIGESFWAKCKAFERNFYFLDENSNIEAARFFEKKAFEEVGGYDLEITGPEDWDLPERINKIYPKKKKIKAYIIHNEGDVSLIKLMRKKHYYAQRAHVYLEKNQISAVSSKTIYFLRPVFYKHWKLWLRDPIVSLGTFTMLTMEFIAGGVGFVQGKIRTKI